MLYQIDYMLLYRYNKYDSTRFLNLKSDAIMNKYLIISNYKIRKGKLINDLRREVQGVVTPLQQDRRFTYILNFKT